MSTPPRVETAVHPHNEEYCSLAIYHPLTRDSGERAEKGRIEATETEIKCRRSREQCSVLFTVVPGCPEIIMCPGTLNLLVSFRPDSRAIPGNLGLKWRISSWTGVGVHVGRLARTSLGAPAGITGRRVVEFGTELCHEQEGLFDSSVAGIAELTECLPRLQGA